MIGLSEWSEYDFTLYLCCAAEIFTNAHKKLHHYRDHDFSSPTNGSVEKSKQVLKERFLVTNQAPDSQVLFQSINCNSPINLEICYSVAVPKFVRHRLRPLRTQNIRLWYWNCGLQPRLYIFNIFLTACCARRCVFRAHIKSSSKQKVSQYKQPKHSNSLLWKS